MPNRQEPHDVSGGEPQPLFSEEDLLLSERDVVFRHDPGSRRTVCVIMRGEGPEWFITISGMDVPDVITLTCEREHVNVLARVLLDASYPRIL